MKNGDFVVSPISNGYLTKLKKYKVSNVIKEEDDYYFKIKNDVKTITCSALKYSLHLEGLDWINIPQNEKLIELSDDQSNELLSTLIRKEFDSTTSESKAIELVSLAYKLDLPIYDEMLNDFELTDFKDL